MKFCIILFLFILILFFLFYKKREYFTIAGRNSLLCPYVTNRERDLIPSASVLIIQGYNYTDVPRLFYKNEYRRPVQYHWDSDSLTYYFTLADTNICDGEWTIETSENIKPIITEGYTQTLLNIYPIFTPIKYIWLITC